MDLSEIKDAPLTKEQVTALDKMAALEMDFLKGMQDIANNLLVNNDTFKTAKQHAVMAVMLFRRSVAKTIEK